MVIKITVTPFALMYIFKSDEASEYFRSIWDKSYEVKDWELRGSRLMPHKRCGSFNPRYPQRYSPERIHKSLACSVGYLGSRQEAIRNSFEKLVEDVYDYQVLVDKLNDKVNKPVKGNSKKFQLDTSYINLINKNQKRLDRFGKDLESLQQSLEGNGSKGAGSNSTSSINKLTSRIAKLEEKLNSLEGSKPDVITGLQSRVFDLEDDKLDSRIKALEDNKLDYSLDRLGGVLEDTFTDFDNIYDRLAAIETSISPTVDWEKIFDSDIDVMGSINKLTSRIEALEA